MMNYVIVGNSAAGLSAAEAIRQNDAAGNITIVSDEKYEAYSRPLISYYLKNKVTKQQMLLRTPDWCKEQNVTLLYETTAEKIDPKSKKVKLSDGKSLSYDKLLLANGSIPFVPPVEGLNGQDNVFTFMDLKSSEEIRTFAKPEMKAVVIGGGLIGMKAAEGLSKICASVTVLELAPRILPTILDDDGSRLVEQTLEQHSIICRVGDTAATVNGEKTVQSLTLKSGETIPCDLLVMAVGVRPNTALAKSAGCQIDRGVLIGECAETSVENIYAAGDVAQGCDVLDGKKKILALWPMAVMQGKTAGCAIAGADACYKGAFAVNAIDFFGLRISTCGITDTEEDGFTVLKKRDDKTYRKFFCKDGLLKGYILIGDISRAGIYTTLVREGIAIEKLGGTAIFDSPEMIQLPADVRDDLLNGGVS